MRILVPDNSNTIGVTLSYGSQSSKSEQTQKQSTSQGSSVMAGRDLSIRATDGDISVRGSRLQAGHDAQLDASRDIIMSSAENSSSLSGKNESKGGTVGVGIGAGSGGWGIQVSASLNKASGSGVTMAVVPYLRAAGIGKGSCHLFRHAMATQMLENGADLRWIQAMLGHRSMESTQIYTQVSIRALQAVHASTHPAERQVQGDNDDVDI